MTRRARLALVFLALAILLGSAIPVIRRGAIRNARSWHGFTIGQAPPDKAVAARPVWSMALHHVTLPGSSFPWQQRWARLSQDGRVMSVTFSTGCCIGLPESPVAPTQEDWRELMRRQVTPPDRFREGAGPPQLDESVDETHIRQISGADMRLYGQAALREVSRRFGPPAQTDRVNALGPMGNPFSTSGTMVRMRWTKPGPAGPETVALLYANEFHTCLSVVAEDVPHPPLADACEGVDLLCPYDWYPEDRARDLARSREALPPPPAPPRPGQENCRSR